MLNPKKITRNARQKAIAFAEKMFDKNLHKYLLGAGLSDEDIRESRKSNIRGAAMGSKIKFKNKNINLIVLRSSNFYSMSSKFSQVSECEFDSVKLMEFINDCLMVGEIGEFASKNNILIDGLADKFAELVWIDLYNLLFEIVVEAEEFYIADVREKTLARARSFYQSAGGMRECASYEGKRPFETAVQTS